MGDKKVIVTVYGAEQICASCVGAPGSKDTYEWLQAAIARKYNDEPIAFEYVDIDQPPNVEKHKNFVKQILSEDLFYPIVFVNDELVAEGVPRLKSVYRALDEHGIELLV